MRRRIVRRRILALGHTPLQGVRRRAWDFGHFSGPGPRAQERREMVYFRIQYSCPLALRLSLGWRALARAARSQPRAGAQARIRKRRALLLRGPVLLVLAAGDGEKSGGREGETRTGARAAVRLGRGRRGSSRRGGLGRRGSEGLGRIRALGKRLRRGQGLRSGLRRGAAETLSESDPLRRGRAGPGGGGRGLGRGRGPGAP